jgi:hypothetical protein
MMSRQSPGQQDYAAPNRQMMMTNVIPALRSQLAKPFDAELEAVNCQRNYVTRENQLEVSPYLAGAVKVFAPSTGLPHGSLDLPWGRQTLTCQSSSSHHGERVDY